MPVKNPMTPAGIEPETFRFVAQHRNHCATAVHFSGVLRLILIFRFEMRLKHGPGSSVGIATDYGPDGPGSNPGGDEIFLPYTPFLGPTQPPVQWVPRLSRG